MNGSILGMRRAEIARNLDEIIAFAGVEKFVDTPVKRYSSGMYVRLAFSVAAHLEPEILIIDEVLSVGDIQFQKKCLGKMDDVSRSGRTVLFVSHNMNAVRQLTTRCILLQRGTVFFDGASDRAIQAYLGAIEARFEQGADLSAWPRAAGDMDRIVEFTALKFGSGRQVFEPDEDLVLDVHVKARDAADEVRVSGTVFHAEGSPVGSFFSVEKMPMGAGEEKTFRLTLSGLRLAPGSYSFGLSLTEGNEKSGYRHYDALMGVLPFEISGIVGEGGTLGTWPHHWD
jgi:lipopolysaccharide transport system ATP-binding protein